MLSLGNSKKLQFGMCIIKLLAIIIILREPKVGREQDQLYISISVMSLRPEVTPCICDARDSSPGLLS